MIRGLLELFSERDLDALAGAVFTVLGRTGLRIYSDEILQAAALSGAEVDRAAGVARFPERLLVDLIDFQKARPWQPQRLVSELAYTPRAGASMLVAPFVYDFEAQAPRPANTQDLVDSIRLGDAISQPEQPVMLSVTRQDTPAMYENIEAYALLLENTANPGVTWCNHVDQLPYILEIGEIWFGDKRQAFPGGVHCVTSPLTMGRMLCRFALLRARLGMMDMTASVMPISGGNAPVTAAGNVVQSASEILGTWAAMHALAPAANLHGGVVGGSMDMRRAVTSFNSPEALLQDVGVCELFRRRFGGHVTFAGGTDYIEATSPGLEAAWEKLWATNVAASFAGGHYFLGGSGALDGARCFSPEQLLIDRDLLGGLWRFGQGIEVSDESLAAEVIDAVGAGARRSFLDQRHTLANYRHALWQPELLRRETWADYRGLGQYEGQVLADAHVHYLDALKHWQPPQVDEAKLKAAWQVVERAKQDLADRSYGD